MIILYRDLLYYIVFYILYYLYLGGFHASDSLSLNGSHPDMLFNLYFFSVICRINILLLLLLRYIVGSALVEMAISTNAMPAIYRNLYENADLEGRVNFRCTVNFRHVSTWTMWEMVPIKYPKLT